MAKDDKNALPDDYKSRLEGFRAKRLRNNLSYGNVQYALKAAFGVKTKASEILSCSRTALVNYIKEHPELEQYAIEANNKIVDIAETKLFESVQKGNMTSARFLLGTKGKHRDYNTRMEHTGKDGEDLFKPTDDDHRAAMEEMMARVRKSKPDEPKKEAPDDTVH